MKPLVVIAAQVPVQPFSGIPGAVIILEIHVLILYRPPQAFYKDVVICPSSMVHANLCARIQKQAGILGTGEVTSLVAVHDFGLMLLQGFLAGFQHEVNLHGIADASGQDIAVIINQKTEDDDEEGEASIPVDEQPSMQQEARRAEQQDKERMAAYYKFLNELRETEADIKATWEKSVSDVLEKFYGPKIEQLDRELADVSSECEIHTRNLGQVNELRSRVEPELRELDAAV